MNKIYLIAIMLVICTFSYAQTCPQPNTIFHKEGDKYIPVPPAGWKFSDNWPSHLDSDNVVFSLAAYGADLHPPTDKDNHVRCYYGNPDLTTEHGVGIETLDVIPESAVSSHQEWYKSDHYYMCGRKNDVNECNFG